MANRESQRKQAQEAREESSKFPWERQLGESRKAFDAFVVYRDLGRARSQEKTARELEKSAQLMARWSAKWDWVGRVSAWVDEQDRQNRLAQVEAVEKMNERHASLAAAITGKVIQKLQTMNNKAVEEMTPTAMGRLLEVGVKVERQARGEAGDVVSDRVENVTSLDHLTTEELEALERIHDNAARRAESGQD